jgi:hypothetical protein
VNAPASISFQAWSICGRVSFGLRPNFKPRRYAAFTQARLGSLIMLGAKVPLIPVPGRQSISPGFRSATRM